MPDLRIEKVVVTGGRHFADGARIEADLRALLPLGLRRVAQGGNGIEEQYGDGEAPAKPRSADTLAWLVAAGLQLVGSTYRVNRNDDARRTWHGLDGDGRRAPLRRNIRMLEWERPDLVLAYPDPDSRGTWHCVREALKREIVVVVWAPHEDARQRRLPAPWLAADELGRVVFGPASGRAVKLIRALDAAQEVNREEDADDEPHFDPGGDHGAECDCYVCKAQRERREDGDAI